VAQRVGERDRAPWDDQAALRAAERAENFPVALRLLPARRRAVLRRIYDVVRTIDDTGDEGDLPPADRLAALDALATDLHRVYAGGTPDSPAVAALAPDVARLPAAPFHDLVAANRADQTITRYATHDELRDYCRLSAVPIGRLVLAAFEVDADDAVIAGSDRVCTALQLLEHWQDVAEDRRAGRIYLPQEHLRQYAVAETDLDRGEASPALRALMRLEIDRAATILEEGAGIVGRLDGWARVSVAGFVAGGRATVRALRRTHGDVLAHAARPSRAGTAATALRLLATPRGAWRR
jgi:squalene synthase HpnC